MQRGGLILRLVNGEEEARIDGEDIEEFLG
jgi:hypothetical protein